MFRGDLTDEEWAVLGGLLPPERGCWARPVGDNRRFVNGMLHVLRVVRPAWLLGALVDRCCPSTRHTRLSDTGKVART